MTQYKRIAIDTSKAVFTLHGIDQTDRPLLLINLSRAQLLRPVVGQNARQTDTGAANSTRFARSIAM